ncbi:mitochondrial ribosomal protein L28-domain-containing protein [Rhizophagus clarus]|uniref:Mitochondrial ribosomal protein L28-domain-containing protein n=1 Tax=Rhizophagus clarus TaxID=94130 RepID=A0A8H3R758_9GLOM|nr:mitochondrial ribosomal protein L28-domain-containing protein [Rhizophagus clarus]
MAFTYFSRSALSTSLARKRLFRVDASKKPREPPSVTPGATNYNITDTRYEVIKRILYETPKPDLPQFTEEDLERHETIERAWQLYLRNKREAKTQLGNKTTLFPSQMKIPTETPPLNGWNYDYVPSPKPDQSQ